MNPPKAEEEDEEDEGVGLEEAGRGDQSTL